MYDFVRLYDIIVFFRAVFDSTVHVVDPITTVELQPTSEDNDDKKNVSAPSFGVHNLDVNVNKSKVHKFILIDCVFLAINLMISFLVSKRYFPGYGPFT